jgi:hypothetical protein
VRRQALAGLAEAERGREEEAAAALERLRSETPAAGGGG